MKMLCILSFITLLFIGCKEDGGVTNNLYENIYSYSAFDSLGVKIVQGWFEISVVDSSQITGNWHFRKTADVGEIGPQIGDGKLEGSIYNDSLFINLNPDFVDNNVILRGPSLDYVTEGEWSWISFIGVANKGTYKIIKAVED